MKVLIGGILQAFAGMTVEAYRRRGGRVPPPGGAPDAGRGFRDCGYLPMVELLRYLEANGFTNYIVVGW